MKKSLLYTALLLLLAFSGCSQKDVEVDTAQETVNSENVDQEYGQDETTIDEDSALNQIDSSSESSTVEDSAQVVEEDAMAKKVEEIKKEVLPSVLFASDKFKLSSEMLDVARENSTKLIAMGNVKVKLEGNCDEWGSDEYNYALGLKRAKTVKDILVNDGFASENISMVSFGESNPTCSEHNKACWTKNRRVDYKLP